MTKNDNLSECDAKGRGAGVRARLVEKWRSLPWLGLCLCWAMQCLSFSAMADHLNGQTRIMDVAGLERASLRGHLEILRSSDHLTVEDVIAKHSQDFRKLPGTLSEGFTSDVLWVSFTLQHASLQHPEEFWVEFDQPLFRSIKLYAWEEGGVDELTGRLPHRLREHTFDYRKASFKIFFKDSLPHRFVARIQTPTAISSDVIVWAPRAFVASHANERFVWGLIFGSYLLVVAFYTVFSGVTRELTHGIYALYVLLTFLSTFFTGAWPTQMVSTLSDDVFYKLLAVWICSSLPVATLFSFRYLGTDKVWPRLTQLLLWVMFAVALMGVVLALKGYQHVAMPVIQSLALLMILCLVSMAINLIRRGSSHAKFFLLAFSPFYIGIAWRFLKNIGLVEHSFMSENAYQMGTFVHVMLMSLGLFASYSNIRKEKEVIEAKLAAESALRKEHADFMSMISHEFRTPLSIIGAASENLLHASELTEKDARRVQKIVDANHRLHELMQNTLSSERLLFEASPVSLDDCDLRACVQRACSDVEPTEGGEICLEPCGPVRVRGNPELIRLAVANLLSNAKRYAPKASEIHVCIQAAQGGVVVHVQDAGCGIPEDEIPRVFDKYFRGGVAAGKPGAGLGLYLVRLIMERHGGQVTVTNNAQVGSTFSLRFENGVRS